MPTYKRLPFVKKRPEPLLHAVDGFFLSLWGYRKIILPALGLILIGVALFQAAGWYLERRALQAFERLEQDDWSPAEEGEFADRSAAAIARFALGRKALDAKEWDKAIGYFQTVTPEHAVIRVAALHNLALAYRGKGDWENALASLKKAEGERGNRVPDYTRLLRAELLRQKGDTQDAKQLFEELGKEAALPELRSEAEARKQWLEKK